MTFISNLASIASNTPLQRLVPDGDGLAKHFGNYRKSIKDGAYQRDLNRKTASGSPDAVNKENMEQMGRFAELEARQRAGEVVRPSALEGAARNATMSATESTRMKTIMEDAKMVDSKGNINRDGMAAMRKGQAEQLGAINAQKKEATRGLRNEARDYFMTDKMGTNAMRWGAAASIYGAGAVGTRTLTGGSATTNNQGQRDIAGIPFL